ncbi:hypothetical protein SAMN05216475_6153 [Pseudomonas synxantha]|uniref:Threonine synthase n=1 Tax=Pseudomonas synxantha TaxID=47883 RepID=A0AAX3HZC6_9PSED|nr:hypothetical protein SAMN05216475_6153 [Pseudomonas synxantha]VTQ87228.1 Uncharacterised protein [Pseudomonas synxantha]
MAVYQLSNAGLTHRYRGQAPSHIWTSLAVRVCILHSSARMRRCIRPSACASTALLQARLGQNVGGGLLPMAVYQVNNTCLAHRYRGQAPPTFGSHWLSGFAYCYSPRRMRRCIRPSAWASTALSQARLGQNVGGGLLPMAVYQLSNAGLTHRYRGQAPSHIWSHCLSGFAYCYSPRRMRRCMKPSACASTALLQARLGQNVGGGLLPMAVYQVNNTCLAHRYRGQAPSHIWISLAVRVCILHSSARMRRCIRPSAWASTALSQARLGQNVGGGLLPMAVYQLNNT